MTSAGDPWAAVRAYGPPNLDWCEEPIGGWILEPANTWSNAAYLLAGLVVWAARGGDASARLFAPALLLLAVLSGLYHASVSFLLQVGDFAGMSLVTGLALGLNLRRLGALAPARLAPFLGTFVAGSLALFFVLHAADVAVQALIAVQATGVAATEAALFRRQPDVDRRPWLLALGLLGAGAAFSAGDLTRAFCDPRDHVVQGHAIWHVLSAAALVALFRFYRDLAPAP